ncbi:MAG: hypothetical protein PUJ33_02915, partial [Prevotella stercorea]|uniref:hypothetical protein n=1 Tax=Leyella stercorea TaxID=363265 RepID=UPI0028031629|nr:hypothetical protein [Leyella stercorea]
AFVLPRMSQICTDVRARCYPTEFAEFTEAGCVCANLNISTSQHLNISTSHHLNTSPFQHLTTSPFHHLTTTTP